MTYFLFINYGGAGDSWLTADPFQEKGLITACQKYYIGGERYYRQETYVINGINVTVHSWGIHKAMTLELPPVPKPSEIQIATFMAAKSKAEHVVMTAYNMFSHNCVTAVATLLHLLDPNITQPDIRMPWTLDKHLSQYCGSYCQNTTEGLFIQKYQEKVHKTQSNTSFWSRKKINSVRDIIETAYQPNKDEKTKSSLLELGWIKESVEGLLVPTSTAPLDFQTELAAYNIEQKRIAEVRLSGVSHGSERKDNDFKPGI